MSKGIGFDGFRGQWLRGGAAAVWAVLAVAEPAESAGGKFTSFDVPDAKGGTFATGINAAGVITGDYGDDKSVAHGFVRNADGTFETFDSMSAPDTFAGTYPVGINAGGVVTGYYLQSSSVFHGFVRAADGTVTSFDAPGGSNTTLASAINDKGVIAGNYEDSRETLHGYVRAADGTITTFDPPGCADTNATSINDRGAIAGSCGSGESFVRTPGGKYKMFGVAGANGTFAYGINDDGVVAGTWNNSKTGAFEGFVRTADGTITTFDPGGDTSVNAIDGKGMIVGYYEGDRYRAFVRDAMGTIRSFDAPGSAATFGFGINRGSITGFYRDSGGAAHGFLRSR